MEDITPDPERDYLERELADGLERLRRSPGEAGLHQHAGELLDRLHRYEEAMRHFREALAVDPQRWEAWYGLGAAASRAGDLDTAAEAFQRAIVAGGDEAVARTALASVRQRQQSFPLAIQEIDRALQLHPDLRLRGQLYSMLGGCYASSGDTEGALVYLEDAVREDPRDMEAQHNLGLVYMWRGQFAAALPHLEKAAELAPQRADNWYELGRAARQVDALETAREAFEKALALGQDDAGVHAELAWVLHRLGQRGAARQHGLRALRLSPEPPGRAWIHEILAACAADLGDDAAELEHRLQAAEAAPYDAVEQYSLGVAYHKRGNFEAAARHLRQAVALAPEDAEAWCALGSAACETGDLKTAREAAARAIALGFNEIDLQEQLIWVLQSLEEWGAVIERASQALEAASDPHDRGWLHQVLANAYKQAGDAELAWAHFQQAVQQEPENAQARFNLAVEYKERGDIPGAIGEMEAATALAPEDAEYRLFLARLYAEGGRRQEAEPMLRQLLYSDRRAEAHINLVVGSIDAGDVAGGLELARAEAGAHPQSAVAWAALCLALRASGDPDGAQEALARARELDGSDPWVITAGAEEEAAAPP